MSHPPFQRTGPSRLFRFGVFGVLIGLALALPGYGQVSPEEHAKHHPGQDKEQDNGGPPGMAQGGQGPAKGMGGGMEGMEKMMEGMGKAPPKELYPSLMSFPELTPEQREQVRGQAHERMESGVALLSEGLDRLGEAAENEDYAAMQEATTQVREALAQFESGLAAQRALTEGKPPRQVALQWFKGEMNLESPRGVEARGGFFGVTLFHLFTMVLLVAFALAMVAMYFFKMRRAAALFGRIEADSGRPPPGSAPPLAGGKPPDGEKPASSDKPAAPADKPAAAAADKPAAPADKPVAADKSAAGADKAADKPAAAPDKPAAAGDKPAAPDSTLAAAGEKLAGAADKLAGAADKLAAPADKPAAAEKLAAPANKPAAPADKPAAPADKPAGADKPASADKPPDKAAAPATSGSVAPPKGNGPAPSAPAQERPAATKFECLAPAARAVFLVGTFNDWNAKATPMIKDAKGNWGVAVALPPGHHEFKFVVDGVSCCEPGCEGPHQGCPKCVPNASGTMNRLIEVKAT